MAKNTQDPRFTAAHFINRELSWLEFNHRVLEEAMDATSPLLERLKFLCIVSSNLDEFFEVRVAGLKQQIESGDVERSVDGLTPIEIFRAVVRRVRRLVEEQYRCWRQDLEPALRQHGIRFLALEELSESDRAWIEHYYRSHVRPVLTPLAIDPAHPFPQLLNKTLNIIVQLEMTHERHTVRHLAVVQVPRILPRVLPLPREDGRQDHVLLRTLIGHFLGDLFPGTRLLGYWPFRVTRNSELYIDEEDAENMLKAVENELHNRRKGDAVRLEVDHQCPDEIGRALLGTLRLTPDDVYRIHGVMDLTRLMAVYEREHSPELRDPPFLAPPAPPLRDRPELLAVIRERDVLLHHPYDSFNSVVEFLVKAAQDPQVLAIKMTLYRTGGDQRIIGALMDAVKNGKQVTAVVELRARFDEANNIQWARQLEENGVHVVYGLVGYKIHAKLCLVVRREDDRIRRYLHLATGNYNPNTARLYTDVGFLTCREEFGEDATNLFNLLTGICQFQGLRKMIAAPFQLHEKVLALIERETAHAARGLPARILARMNSLVDEQIIEALYRASQAGVRIDLVIRGICCLRPGVPGVSDTISVRSIVDRFLEHSRIWYFENACRPEVFLSSADWMPRNFFRRIEVAFPIDDGVLRERVIDELLAITFGDNVKARVLRADGTYALPALTRSAPRHRSQNEFMELALHGRPTPVKLNPRDGRYRKMKLAPRPPGLPPTRPPTT